MSIVLTQQAIIFNPSRRVRDNKLISVTEVSENQSQQDNCMVASLQNEIAERLETQYKLKSIKLNLINEPRSARCLYEDKGGAMFINDALSVHHFTDESGKITRRVVILYPMSVPRRGELPKFQLLRKLNKAVEAVDRPPVELFDLRYLENDGKTLEGLAAMVFSHDGQFVYMGLSSRSSEEVLAHICSPKILDIPEEKRFVFTVAFPRLPSDKSKVAEDEVLCHTSIAGWCGKGICAWGFELLRFPSEETQEAFYEHLEVTYKKIINLSVEEIRAFAGNAFEIAIPTENGERRALCISESAFKALNYRNARILKEWYGEDNIVFFYADVLHRRAGTSIRGIVSLPVVHGCTLPYCGQESALEVARVHEKDMPCLIRR